MAGVQLDGPQLVGIAAAGPHEGQRPVDLARQPLVALPGRAGPDEVLVPGVHLVQVGVAAGGEGAAQVQRHGRAVVGAQQAAGIGRPGRRGEVEAVDRVAAVGGQLDAVARPRSCRGPRLGELPGHPADLDHRDAGPVGQHDGHLQQGLQLGAHGLGGGAGERLGAVAALQHERLAAGDRGQPVPQLIALAGEDQRRQPGQLGGDGGQRARRPASPAAARRAVAPAGRAAGEPVTAVMPGRRSRPGSGQPRMPRDGRGGVARRRAAAGAGEAVGGAVRRRAAADAGRMPPAAVAAGRRRGAATWPARCGALGSDRACAGAPARISRVAR